MMSILWNNMRYLLLMLVVCQIGYGRARLRSSLSDLQVINHGRLQKFWAQQAIGVPDGHKFLAELSRQGTVFHRTRVGVLDTGFYLLPSPRVRFSAAVDQQIAKNYADQQEPIGRILLAGLPAEIAGKMRLMFWGNPREFSLNHGTMVTHLIAGQSPVGISINSEIDLLVTELKIHPFADDSEVVAANVSYYQMVADIGDSLPEVINFSVFVGGKEEAVPLAKIAQQSTLVVSAGNSFPNPMERGLQKLAPQVIVVGSITPEGRTSDFSPHHESEVTILAPSDYHLSSCGFDSKCGHARTMSFGGTSGAAPLVSGALADVISILPGLQVDEARQLLTKTAIKTTSNPTGSLNYYKMLRVAMRIVEAGWPAQRQLLFTEASYDFGAEVQQLLDSDRSLEALRKAFFLDDATEVRQLLGKLYLDAGYRAESAFYGN